MPATAHRPELPPGLPVWRGNDLARGTGAVLRTGHAALDAQLPGGGWPAAGLVELLQPAPVRHEWALLAPALAALLGSSGRRAPGPLVLVGAPGLPGLSGGPSLQPFAPALAARGLPPDRLLWVAADEAAARLWACEQALRCADVPAVLAWLMAGRGARADALRRLHLAALEQGKPLFVFRPEAARHESSAAPLRLLIEGAPPGDALAGEGSVPRLRLLVLKRRGPPLEQPVLLPAQPPRLAALLAARPGAVPGATQQGAAVPPLETPHALDRAVAA